MTEREILLLQPSLVPNTRLKPRFWHMRNSWEIRGMPFPWEGWVEDGKLKRIHFNAPWEVVVPGPSEDEMPNVRCRTFRIDGHSIEEYDGAEGIARPGQPSPFQFVGSETKFSECALRGRAFFLLVSKSGDFTCYYYDVGERQNAAYEVEVDQGCIMRWYPCREQELITDLWGKSLGQKSFIFRETERPGFSSAKLLTVEEGVNSFSGTPIPSVFWKVNELLKNGFEDEVLAQSVIIPNLER